MVLGSGKPSQGKMKYVFFLACKHIKKYPDYYTVSRSYFSGFDKSLDTDIMGEQIAPYESRLK
jgi:hypothetical protein